MELIIDSAYVRKPPSNPKSVGFGELPGGGAYLCAGRVTHPKCTGTETPVVGILPDLALCVSSYGYSFVSFITSFNKLVNLSVSLSSSELF